MTRTPTAVWKRVSKNPYSVPWGHKLDPNQKPRGMNIRHLTWQGGHSHWAGASSLQQPQHLARWDGGLCLHQSLSPASAFRFSNKIYNKISGDLCITSTAESSDQKHSKPIQFIFTPLFWHVHITRTTTLSHSNNSSGLVSYLWHFAIGINVSQSTEWALLRPYSFGSQGTSRAGGGTLTTMFNSQWNTSLSLRCLVPFGICVYFQPSCHLVATHSTNQQRWKRTSLTSCLINNFAGWDASVLWETAKLSKVIAYSASPHCTLF